MFHEASIVLTPNPDRLQGKKTKALLPEEDTEKALNMVSAEKSTAHCKEPLWKNTDKQISSPDTT